MKLDIEFEWDDEKAKKNLQKHGVSFQIARRVFGDDYRIERYDEEHSHREERFITIGSAGDILLILCVIYTEREGIIRIISARKADSNERSEYYARKNNAGR